MKEYPHLDKPCYKKNFNEGQKNLKEIFAGTTFYIPNVLIITLFFWVNVLFVINS